MPPSEGRAYRGAGLFTAVSAVFVALIALVSLVSWAVGVEMPTRLLPRAPQMVPNTAIGLLFGAVGLWFARAPAGTGSRNARVVVRGAAGVVVVIGGLTMLEYLTGIDMRIDRLIFNPSSTGTRFPGRPSPQTALAFVLLGGALLTLESSPRRRFPLAQALSVVGAAIGALALTGYAFDIRNFYGSPEFLPYTGMAVSTATATLALGAGVLTSRPDVGVMRLFTSDGAGGRTLRVLLPAVIGAPFFINFFALRGVRADLFTESYALALAAAASVVVLLVIALLIAAAAERADARRVAVERALRRSRSTYRDALIREQEATKQLREIDDMKDSFLRAVSHELRTPLTAVIGFAETLVRPEIGLSAEQMDLASRISSNARRLNDLFIDLLDLDRLSRGIFSPRRRPIDVAALIDDVAALVDLRGRLLDVRLDSDAAVAFLDPSQVGRIIENLITNAVRHTPAGTPISVSARPGGGGIVFSVEDRGPGVPGELRETIFQPFVRGPEATFVHGVGVGLSLVRRFAELHGGRAWVDDRPGGGASFHVALPTWPLSDRRRVLLVSRPEAGFEIEHKLHEAGYEAALCAGTGNAPMCAGCPLVATGSCALAEGAHVVVFTRDIDDEANLEILRTYRVMLPQTPVIVEADDAMAARRWEVLDGCTVIPPGLDSERLVGFVRQALGEEIVVR